MLKKTYARKQHIVNAVQKLKGNTTITHIVIFEKGYVPPMYIHTPFNIMLLMSGGYEVNEKYLLCVLQNEHNNGYTSYYINDEAELNKLLEKTNVKKTQIPRFIFYKSI